MILQEFPFSTLSSLPEGVVTHIGGVVCARAVKLLDKIDNPGMCVMYMCVLCVCIMYVCVRIMYVCVRIICVCLYSMCVFV